MMAFLSTFKKDFRESIRWTYSIDEGRRMFLHTEHFHAFERLGTFGTTALLFVGFCQLTNGVQDREERRMAVKTHLSFAHA